MKKVYVCLMVACYILMSCTPSSEAIQKAIEQTQMADPLSDKEFAPTQMPNSGNWVLEWNSTSDVSIWQYERRPLDSSLAELYLSCSEGDFYVLINADNYVDVNTTRKEYKFSETRIYVDDYSEIFSALILFSGYGFGFDANDTAMIFPKFLNADKFMTCYTSFEKAYCPEFDLYGLENAMKPLIEACGASIPY